MQDKGIVQTYHASKTVFLLYSPSSNLEIESHHFKVLEEAVICLQERPAYLIELPPTTHPGSSTQADGCKLGEMLLVGKCDGSAEGISDL